MKQFEYLHLGRYMHIEEFFQHIEEIGHIDIPVGTTYGDLANNLREKYKDDPERLKAVNDWIEFNTRDDFDQDAIIFEENAGYLTYNIITK